jgi:Ca-activated chloride channel homolog
MSAMSAASLQSENGDAAVLVNIGTDVLLRDLVSETSVSQTYRNYEEVAIEAVYTFPLPSDAVLLEFSVQIGDRHRIGKVIEKTEAETRYEAAIDKGNTAVLLEQTERGLYTASLGNLLPGEEATIRFRYGLLLSWNGDHVRLMIPATITPRYGDPLGGGLSPHQVPETSLADGPEHELSLRVEGLLEEAEFMSPSHSIVSDRDGETVSIHVNDRNLSDRDFVLQAKLASAEKSSAVLSRDIDGWVVLASFCPEVEAEKKRGPAAIKIIVGCSGSMAGDSIEEARTALKHILGSLKPQDSFDLITFGSHSRSLLGRLTKAEPRVVRQAQDFVGKMDADMGGTEIEDALNLAFDDDEFGSQINDIFLITDGTFWNAGDISGRASQSGHRIFTVGVGSSVSETSLRQLAEKTNGACEFINPSEDMAERIERHFERMLQHRSDTIKIEWPVDPEVTTPSKVSTAYSGDTVHVMGWFRDKPEGDVYLNLSFGEAAPISQSAVIEHPSSPASDTASELPPSLTRIAAGYRLATMRSPSAGAIQAVQYQLMSQWTNYLIIDQRVDKEAAADLPLIKSIALPHPAGSHGSGSVLASKNHRVAYSLSLRSNEAKRLIDFEEQRHAPLAQMVPRALRERPGGNHREAFARFIGELNKSILRRHPLTVDQLHRLGLPAMAVATLRSCVYAGNSEQDAVVYFLALLLKHFPDANWKPSNAEFIQRMSTNNPSDELLEHGEIDDLFTAVMGSEPASDDDRDLTRWRETVPSSSLRTDDG